MKLRKWIAGATCACMLLTLSPPTAVLAETMPQVTNSRAVAETPYWDWDADQKKLVEKKTNRAPQEVTSALKEWSAGWYIVNRDVILDARVTVTGEVHLILADGATLTLKGGIQVADNDDNVANGSANALTIYGQAQGSGALKIEDVDKENTGIGGNNGQRGGTITINGGAVTGANGNYGIGGNGANVTINAGAVTVTARHSGIGGDGANVTINGGTVSAASTYVESRGIGGPNANVVINGGTVTAGPPKSSGCGIEGASVAVNGGTVTASGKENPHPGIKGDTVTIGSGTVIATGGVTLEENSGVISKRQAQGITGNFNTTAPGNAIIVAQSGIEDKTHKQNWQANIIIDGPEGIFNVNPLTLTEDLTIPEESNFVVPKGGTLEIPSGVTLTNKGTLTIDGYVDNSAGTLDNQGAVTGSGTLVKKVSQPVPVLSEISFRDLSIDKSEERINGWNKAYLVYDAETGGTIIRDPEVNSGVQYITEVIDQGKSLYVGKRETDFCYASDRVLWFENTGRHPMPTLTYDADQGGVVVPGGYKYLYNQRPNPDSPYSRDNSWQDGNGQLVKVEWGKKLYVYQARYSDELNSPIQEIAVGLAPNAPELESVTATTVTLKTIPPDDAGAPVEYSMDDGKNWQDSPTFTGLTPNTEYTFIARYKAHNGKPASANSWGGNITTESPNYELTVTAPTLEETYGYSQPAAKALTINCTGNIDATIQSVTLGADSKFEIVPSQDTTVPMEGENTSWQVQPKADLDAGTYTDTITVTDKGGKTATAEVKLTVNKADATVDTPPTAIEGLTYTGEEQVLITAGSATGGELQYSLSEDADTFKKNLPTGNKAASYRVFYRVKGDANHNDSEIGSVTVKIGKAEASITKEPKGKILTYNGEAQALVEAGVTSAGELQYSLKENRDFSTDIPKGTDAGNYTVYYRIVGDSSTSGQGTVWSVDAIIDKSTAVVKQAPKPVENLVYTGKDQELVTAGTTNGCTLQYSTDGKTYSKELPKATAAGKYTVWYKVEGEKNYTDVAPQSVAVKIAKATPQVTVTAAQNLSYTGKAQALIEAGTTSGGSLQYSLTEKGDYSTTIPQGTNAGNYTVWYKVVGGDNYNDVAPQSVAVTIQPANAVVTEPQAKTDLTYNGKAQALLTKGETNGGKWQYSTDGNTYQDAVPMATDAGTYTVHYKLDGEGNVKDIPAKSVSVTIKKADPQVTAPTAKTLSYTGEAQALVNAGTTNGGTLQYSLTENGDYSTTVPTGTNADTYTVYYKVVGDKNYNDVAAKSITVTIDKATPQVKAPTAKTLTYTGEAQALIEAGITTGGTLQYSLDDKNYSTDIPQGTEAKTYTVYYKVVGNTNYKDVAPQSVKVTIAKAAASIDQAPTAKQDLVYNGQDQALINAGTATGGELQYSLKKDSDFSVDIPTGNAAKEYTVYYKVVGDANHADSEVKSVPVTIAKATPTVDTPSGLTATYGQTLKDVTLPTHQDGVWTWKDSAQSVGDAGKNTFQVVFTPKDATNYNTVEKTVEVTVAKATPKVEVPSGLTATYGQTLKDVKLPSNDQGAWTWETPGQSVGDLGTKTFQAIYTPKDTANYNTVEKMVEVTVGKATMDVETPSGLTATYGDTLKDVALPTSDKGAWKWNDPETTPVGDVGDRSFKATFTPKDSNYNPVEKTVTIVVKQATPTVDAPTGLTATYGQTLKDVKLPSAEWAWKDSAQSVGNVGPHDFVAIYTPADTNYKAVEKTVTVTVKQAEPSVQVPTDLTATYGDTLADVKLPSAEWTWKADEKTSVGDAGKHEFVAIYTPTDKNYKVVEKTVAVTVKQATPKVEAPSGLTATYGDTLKSVALPTSDKGSWAWKDSTQSVGDAGTNTFVAVYTPNDKNYKAVDVEVGVTVEKATPQVTAPTGITASYGQTLADVKLPSNDQGAWTWVDPSQSVGALGEKNFQATFTPKDSKNYTTVTMAVTVTVKQAAAKVTKAPQAVPNLTYSGQSFDLVTAGEATGGKLQYRLGEQGDYKDAIPQAKEAGTYAIYYKVKGDTNHSDLVVDTPIQVTIAKAPQTALKAPEAESVTRTAITLKAVADSANGIKAEYGIKTGDGSFKWQANPAFDNLSEGTNYTFKVRYAESANYLGAESAEAVIRTDRTPSKPVNPPSKPIDPPTVPDVEGGDVTVTPSRPTSGQTVTITPQPEEGMVVDKVIVTDKNGNKIEVTQKPNGDFTFEQPSSEVTVTVTFKPEGEEGPSGDLPFADVTQGAWYEDAVEYVYENGLIMGVADGQFAPNMTTDRGQLVTMLWRLAGEPQAENSTDFGDVPSSAYYAKAVAWAAENGITAGFEDGTFRPTTGLSREQMAALFMKYAQAIGLDTSARADISGFTDINPDSWSYDALSWAKAVGLLNGVGNATMAPQDTATRAQIAAVLQRYCETIAK